MGTVSKEKGGTVIAERGALPLLFGELRDI
jgi:hypothetical protein